MPGSFDFTVDTLGRRMDATVLRKAFAVFVIGLALFLLYDNLPKIL